jgi:hypothetical protein
VGWKCLSEDIILATCSWIYVYMLAYNWQVWDREKVVLIPDHYIFTADERANRNVDILREFALEQDIKYFYDIKDLSNFKVIFTSSPLNCIFIFCPLSMLSLLVNSKLHTTSKLLLNASDILDQIL